MASNSTTSDVSAPLEVISDTDQGGLVAILAAFSLSLVLVVSLPIRTYVRSTMSTYKVDDYAFLAASLFSIVQTALVFYQVHIGFGKTGELVDPGEITPMEKAAYASDIFYICALSFSKLSTAFLFLRLTSGRGHVLAIWSTISLSVAWNLVSIVLVSLRCHPTHPWDDTFSGSQCTGLFPRWQFIGALNIITELALFAISVYLVWDLHMSRKSKSGVVGAFGCRLPIIAIVGLRLYYLHDELNSINPTFVGAAAASCTQIEIGYSIMASILPCLKTFMAPYERPDHKQISYHHSGNGTNHKLSSIASRSDHAAFNAPAERVAPVEAQYRSAGAGKRMILGKPRSEQTAYEARVTHNHSDKPRRSLDSGNSQRMIIKKGVEWSVDYDTREPSTLGKDEDTTAEEARSER